MGCQIYIGTVAFEIVTMRVYLGSLGHDDMNNIT